MAIGTVNEIANAYRNNPAPLAERYNVEKQLVDLLALQQINTEQQAISNQMDMDLQQQAMASGQGVDIAQQTAQETLDLTSNNMMRMAENAGLGGIINERNAEMAAASGGMLRQGGLDHIPSNIKNMSGGGIIAFANGTEDNVIDSSRLVGQNNPFNIRDYDQGWEGQTGSTEGFVDFDNLHSGVRAADKLIDNYPELKGISTIRELIATFAPASENDTEAYIDFVSETIGIPADQPIDLDDPSVRDSVLGAMGRMESGFQYDPSMLEGTDRARTPEEMVASDVGDRTESDVFTLPSISGNVAANQGDILAGVGQGVLEVLGDTLAPQPSMEEIEASGGVVDSAGNVGRLTESAPMSSDPFDPTNERYTEMANLGKEEYPTGEGESIENQILGLFTGVGETNPPALSPEMDKLMVEGITGIPTELMAGEGGEKDATGEDADTTPPSEPAMRGPDWDRFIAGATAGGGATSASGALRGFAQGTQAYDQLRFGQFASLREIDANLQTALFRYRQALDTAEWNGVVDQMIEWRNGQEYQDLLEALDGMPSGPAKEALVKQIEVRQAQAMNEAVRKAMGKNTGSGQGPTASGIAQIQSTPYSS